MASTDNPPSYDDAVALPGRQPPAQRPEPQLTHTINITTSRPSASAPLAIPFPADEAAWTSPARDVQHADWERFVSNLAEARIVKAEKKDADEGEPSEEQTTSMREALALWNKHFFEPRGCKVQAAGFEELEQTNASSAAMDFGNEGVSFKKKPNRWGVNLPGGIFIGFGAGNLS